MLTTWLTATVLGIGAVVATIAASWSFDTYRTLKRNGAPGARRILRKLWLAPFASLLKSGSASATPGQLAWIWSDLRWGPSHQTEAAVQAIEGEAIRLTLTNPITVYTAAGEALRVTDVRFIPDDPGRGLRGVPAGVIEPVVSTISRNAPAERPRARLCLLDEDTA